jgi:RNA polymerase sigma factor (sigma-70 family)
VYLYDIKQLPVSNGSGGESRSDKCHWRSQLSQLNCHPHYYLDIFIFDRVMSNISSLPPELRQFNVEIQSLLTPQNPRARSLHSFIKRTLKQFHLDGFYTEFDIFNQAYLRGVSLTRSGTAINNPKAWMRTTAYNVIREYHRRRRRYRTSAYDELAEADRARREIEFTQVLEADIELDIQAVASSLTELSPEDRQLIGLRVVEGLSWKEVSQRLVALGENQPSEASLRKRGQRALCRLRLLYHQKRPSRSTNPEAEYPET